MIADMPSISLRDVTTLDSQTTLVLTVNNRHARRLVAEFSASLNDQQRVMALPDILPLSAWMRQMADELSFLPDARLSSHVLDNYGALTLWRQVISECESANPLLDVTQAARLAMEADKLVSDWRLVIAPHQETGEYQRFKYWRESYRQRLLELDAEDATVAFENVHEAIAGQQLAVGATTVVLAGFNELSPRLDALMAALQMQGVSVVTLSAEKQLATEVNRVIAPDPVSEWRLAAQWARQQLEEFPQGRYAIVAASLESAAVLAHRVLREALATTPGEQRFGYNIAVGRPLTEWPAARGAIAWLRLISAFLRSGQCTPQEAGTALLAGHCAGAQAEYSGRAGIDALWRHGTKLSLDSSEFTQRLAERAPALAQAWKKCLDAAFKGRDSASADVWATRFRDWLSALGFPGGSTLDSHAFQTVEAFDRLLQAFAGQALVLGPLTVGGAVSALEVMAGQTLFQPQRDPDARLDVLGFLEAEGGRWDGVWVLGLTDEVLPAAPRPNPFIPLASLREADAPRATPERELQWAQTMFGAMLCCAPNVMLSSAEREGERELNCSPCIAQYPGNLQKPVVAAVEPAKLESVTDDRGPALTRETVVRGGIAVLDTQSRNPLWAFARYRLGARHLPGYAELGDQNARGIFLHRCMELIGKQFGDQEALILLHEQGTVNQCIDRAVVAASTECLNDYPPVLRELECERARGLLMRWLEFECERPDFAIVGLEQDYQWAHGALSLKLRVDRIDRLEDGSLAVIDFKTGNIANPSKDWARPRPVALQLPFYAAVLAQDAAPVSALVLARLHAQGVEVKGLAEGDDAFHGLPTVSDWPALEASSWAELMSRWRAVIQQLAADFEQGVAINVSADEADLNYCDVLPFLRLNEEAVHDA